MPEESERMPKIFQGSEHHVLISGAVELHVYLHLDHSALAGQLKQKTEQLQAAVAAANPQPRKETIMANPILDPLEAQIAATNGVIDSAIALINGIAAKIAEAVQAALAGGATAAELAPLTDLNAALKAKSDALAAAVANNP